MDEFELGNGEPAQPWIDRSGRPIDIEADRKVIVGQIMCPACSGHIHEHLDADEHGDFEVVDVHHHLGASMVVYAVAPAECLLCGHLIEPRT